MNMSFCENDYGSKDNSSLEAIRQQLRISMLTKIINLGIVLDIGGFLLRPIKLTRIFFLSFLSSAF